MKRITGRLTEKNGKWYAVINLYTAEGKRKEKWTGLDLEAKKGTKTEAAHRLNELLSKYNSGDLYLKESLTHAEQERMRLAEQKVDEYIVEWLESHKCNISVLTYNSYKRMTDGRVVPYFRKLGIPLKELTGDEVNEFYISLRNNGLTGATAQRYHSMLHLAFKQAVKRRVIPTNPCDQADRPKAVQYIGTYYNSEEIKQLLDCLDGDPMKIAIILTAYYGLRRSEVLGLKWDAIDTVEDKIYIRHKIIENKLNGNAIKGLDVMKTKSSYRSLPLMPFIKKALEEEKARQEEMQRGLRKSYNRKYLDYVCVDAMGDILKPQYVSEHFKVILERNGLKEIRFHDLRHSCASLMLANDISMKEIQEWLGHSNISTTANIYAHVDSESKRESARIIDKVLSSEKAV
jgi:integrase